MSQTHFNNYATVPNNIIQRLFGIISNKNTVNKLIQNGATFVCTLIIVSTLHYILKGTFVYFCYDSSIWGVFTNLFTIYNPVCYWLNWGQWHLSESIITLTLTLMVTFVQKIFSENPRHSVNNERVMEDNDDDDDYISGDDEDQDQDQDQDPQ